MEKMPQENSPKNIEKFDKNRALIDYLNETRHVRDEYLRNVYGYVIDGKDYEGRPDFLRFRPELKDRFFVGKNDKGEKGYKSDLAAEHDLVEFLANEAEAKIYRKEKLENSPDLADHFFLQLGEEVDGTDKEKIVDDLLERDENEKKEKAKSKKQDKEQDKSVPEAGSNTEDGDERKKADEAKANELLKKIEVSPDKGTGSVEPTQPKVESGGSDTEVSEDMEQEPDIEDVPFEEVKGWIVDYFAELGKKSDIVVSQSAEGISVTVDQVKKGIPFKRKASFNLVNEGEGIIAIGIKSTGTFLSGIGFKKVVEDLPGAMRVYFEGVDREKIKSINITADGLEIEYQGKEEKRGKLQRLKDGTVRTSKKLGRNLAKGAVGAGKVVGVVGGAGAVGAVKLGRKIGEVGSGIYSGVQRKIENRGANSGFTRLDLRDELEDKGESVVEQDLPLMDSTENAGGGEIDQYENKEVISLGGITHKDWEAAENELTISGRYSESDVVNARIPVEDRPEIVLLKEAGIKNGDRVRFYTEKERNGTVRVESNGAYYVVDSESGSLLSVQTILGGRLGYVYKIETKSEDQDSRSNETISIEEGLRKLHATLSVDAVASEKNSESEVEDDSVPVTPKDSSILEKQSNLDRFKKYDDALKALEFNTNSETVNRWITMYVNELLELAEGLDLPVSDMGKDKGWAKFDIGRQYYLFTNPGENDSKYEVGNPISSPDKQREILCRQLGWEAYFAYNSINSKWREKIDSDPRYASALELLRKPHNERNTLDTDELAELGDLLLQTK